MADKKGSGIQYDDFVSAIRSDPAQSEPLIMLAGYVGKSETDGNLRIYPDASLSNWYEASQDDVVHARPIADSPLGGSNVWLKGNARITPGAASFPAPEPKEGEDGEEAGEAAPQVGADTGVFNPLATIHPTLWTQIGCPTYGCLPGGTEAVHGPYWTAFCMFTQGCTITQQVCPTLPPHCPGATHPPGCGPEAFPQTAATMFTQQGCPSQHPQCGHGVSAPGCLPPRTVDCAVLSVPGCLPPTHMLGCPRTSTCPPTLMPGCLPTSTCPPQTHLLGCPSTSTCPPTQMLGCPSTSTCPPTQMLGCPQTSTCPPTQMLGCPRTSTCPPTQMLGCPQTSTCPPTQMLGCPQTHTCPPTYMPGCPNTRTCTPGGGYDLVQTGFNTLANCTAVPCGGAAMGAEAVHISLPGCVHTGPCLLSHNCPPPPTHMYGCPDTSTCPPTHMMGCPSTSTCPPTHMMGCPSTSTCPQDDASTAATVCTQLGCPMTIACPAAALERAVAKTSYADGCIDIAQTRFACTYYRCPSVDDGKPNSYPICIPTYSARCPTYSYPCPTYSPFCR